MNGLAQLARLQLLRTRQRVLARRRGVEIKLRPDERDALRSAVMSGTPIPDVAARFGVSDRQVTAATRGAWADLLARAPEGVGDRVCRRCEEKFALKDRSDRREYCSVSCASSARWDAWRATHPRTRQDELGEADINRSVRDLLDLGENGATARPGGLDAK